MDIMKVIKEFKLVGLRGSGEFVNFGNEVPLLAKQVLSRANEILNPTAAEIALFEPKRDEEHRIGQYFVGLIVNERLSKVPIGMDYIEINNSYVTTKGNMLNLEELHVNLLKWSEEQGFQRELDSYIVETYHPLGKEMKRYRFTCLLNFKDLHTQNLFIMICKYSCYETRRLAKSGSWYLFFKAQKITLVRWIRNG